jgi:hypothetical protein
MLTGELELDTKLHNCGSHINMLMKRTEGRAKGKNLRPLLLFIRDRVFQSVGNEIAEVISSPDCVPQS